MMLVQPTVRGRIVTLDVLRGLAVLGILIANIPSFGSAEMFGGTARHLTPVDRWVEVLATVFVQGKFRSMLAILFGVGVWLQFQKRSQVEGNWPGGYVKRSLWLGLIGLLHGLLIWFGDILFFYAGMAIATCLLVRLDGRVLKATIVAFATLTLLCGGGLAALSFAYGGMGGRNELEWIGSPETITRIFQQGSYLQQLGVRAAMFGIMMFVLTFLGLAMLPLFLLGVLFGRSGVLSCPSAHPTTRKAALAIGFGVGLPLNLLAIFGLGGQREGFEMLAEFVGGPLLSVGYLMGGAVIVEGGWLRKVTRAAEGVGRIALTSYLSQSIICAFIFYSWGLGLIGRLLLWQMMLVVPVVWTVNLLFARLWLRRYELGPVEWLWRSLTEGRRLPLRPTPSGDEEPRTAAEAAKAEPAKESVC